MWVKFTGGFRWKPSTAITIAYKEGTIANVTKACGNAAIEQGKAKPINKTRRDEEELEAWQPSEPQPDRSTSE